ncbi:hypothetical protein GQ53DRAFT_672833 [Thozetella sp. PMI_491]|nr:hypothetical protein GQ53DRAFT_672833 [Thozetella sp. PMI_491]
MKRGQKIFRTSWWWWWEIGSALLSTLSMGLIVFILNRADNIPLESWPYSIKINTLIAVLTTIGKAAMLGPVASCLSQLKWQHFSARPRRLQELQVFDDASRGLWGSFMFLFGIRSRALLAWSLALITIVSLGVEPTAQQVLDFPTRMATTTNVSAEIGQAKSYRTLSYTSGKCLP